MTSESLSEGTLVYPRLTTEYLKSLIQSVTYSHVPEARTTVCTVMLKIDYSITESVVCPNPDLYDPESGERHAMNKVLAAIREREYYLLRYLLHREKLSKAGDN
jgi:hypothetical protein